MPKSQRQWTKNSRKKLANWIAKKWAIIYRLTVKNKSQDWRNIKIKFDHQLWVILIRSHITYKS